MRGMKSLVAPTKRQNFADGGVVGAIKGMFGIKPEDPERARRLAEYQANAAREKEAAKAATAPAPAPAPAITDYAAGSALKRREAAAGLKDGGPVRGPGTGTSDDVPDNVPEGTYIMPADSTQAIGEKTLGGLGMRGIDVNLSNGEFKLPPKQVHAIGVQALNQMKDATHTPSSTEAAKGMKPELFFEGGGVVDEEKKRLQNQKQAYVTGAQAAAAAAPATPAAPVPAAPAPAAKDPLDGGAAFGVFPQLAGGKRTTYAMDEKLRTGVEATGPSTFVQATPLDKTIIGGGNGQRMNATQDPRSLLTATGMNAVAGVSPPPTPSPPGAAQPGSPAASASTGKPPEMGGNLPTPQSDATSTAVAPGVYQHGRGQYSDNASGMGVPAGFTGQPSAQSAQAAETLAGRSQQESMNRVTGRGMGALSGPGSGPVEPGSFTGGFSGVIGTDPRIAQQERERSALASALSSPLRGAQNGQLTASQRQGMAGLLDSERRDASGNRQADQTAATQRSIAAMREAGDNGRAVLREDGENTRSTARNQIDVRRVSLDERGQAPKLREAERIDALRTRYENAKPEERKAIAQQIRELQGSNVQQDVWAHSPGGQVVDPKTQQLITQPGVIYNRATGETRSDSASTRLPPLAENPAVQQIMNNTALSREERAKQIRALGYQ